jgi:hypothetical protein
LTFSQNHASQKRNQEESSPQEANEGKKPHKKKLPTFLPITMKLKKPLAI